MNKRLVLPLVLLTGSWLALATMPPGASEATAQDVRSRRDDEGDRGERGGGGDSRRGEGRRRGRGQFGFGGDREGGRDGGREFRRDGGGGEGGFRFRRRRDEEGDRSDERPTRLSGGSSFGGGNLDTTGYARRLVQENDKDGNMMLDKAEQSGLRGPAARADFNNDGVIVVEEIVAALSPGGAAGNRANAPRSVDAAGSERGDAARTGGKSAATSTSRVYTALSSGSGTGKAADQRRTYRFTPAADRLPATGLPSWFRSRDRNHDGQVSMSEYSRSWSDRLVTEFGRYDRNNDGVVTAKEAAQQ